MSHLNETEFIDLLDGRLPPSRTAHLAACADCASQLDALRETLASIDGAGTESASPLFWEHFASRVAAAINEQPQTAWWLRKPALVVLGCAAAVLVAVIAVFIANPWSDPSATAPVAIGAPDPPVPLEGTGDHDAAWAAVRTAAEELDYDDALAAGISAGPGAAERAVMELSDEQRAELLRLIEREIKRSGGA